MGISENGFLCCLFKLPFSFSVVQRLACLLQLTLLMIVSLIDYLEARLNTTNLVV